MPDARPRVDLLCGPAYGTYPEGGGYAHPDHIAALGLRHASDLLASLDATTAEHVSDQLRATLVAHHTGSGVLFDSRA